FLIAGFFLFLLLVDLDDFRREKAHFFYAADSLVLAGDFEGAFGLFAMGIHRHVIIFGHTAPSVSLLWVLRKGHVYFTTSSMVVSPSKMLRKPSSRKVTMPSSMA